MRCPQRVGKTALCRLIIAPFGDFFAIVFSHLRVKLRRAKGETDPLPLARRSARRRLKRCRGSGVGCNHDDFAGGTPAATDSLPSSSAALL